MMRPSVSLLLLASLAVCGCSSGPASHVQDVPISTSLPPGWTVAENKEEGLAIGIAPGWKSGTGAASVASTMSDMGVGDSAQNVDPNNPMGRMMGEFDQAAKLDEAKEMAELAKKHVFLHVVDSSKPVIGEERTRYYVKKVAQGGNASLEKATGEEEAYLPGSGKPEPVTLPIGKAMRINAEATNRGGDKVNHISFVLVDGKYVYVLRFASTNNPEVIRSIADGVAQTLRIKPNKDN